MKCDNIPFSGLVVAPTAQDTVRIRVKDEYLVRSFKDGRYYTVPKKEANEFTREMSLKQDGAAVSAALEYLDNDLLPPHWDREALFGVSASSSDFDPDYESDSSDDEPTEEKDHFVAQLYKFNDDKGTPWNKGPSIINRDVDLYRLFRAVQKLGGYNRVTSQKQWKSIALRLGFKPATASITNLVRQAYKKFLHSFEEFNRKLGCTMVAHPRANRVKGRSMVRAGSVASPKLADLKEKLSISSQNTNEESENTSESSSTETTKTKRKLSSTSSGKVKSLVEKYEEKVKESVVSTSSAASSTSTTTSSAVSPTTPTPSGNTGVTPTLMASSVKKEKIIKKIDDKRGRKKKDSVETSIIETKKEPPENLGPSTSQSNISTHNSSSSVSSSSSSSSQTAGNPASNPGTSNSKLSTPTTSNRQTTITTESQNFPIEVGDKLKVYYDEQKVTYEAKVIEIAMQEGSPIYLVHYTGWNTRYDEWVRKERIAENITNTKSIKKLRGGKVTGSRSSLSPASAISATPSGKNPKRLRGGSKGDSRSTTPLSSSRTKSPATPIHRRVTRGQPSSIIRRTSNNTDISSLQTDTDSDSDEPIKKLQTSLMNAANQQTTPVKNEHPSDRSENASNTDEFLNGAKGRDYDLNQIRSELKGFKEMKSPSPETDVSTASTVGTSNIAMESKSEESSGNSEKSTNLSSTMTNNTTASELSASESLGSSEDDSNKASDIESVKNTKNIPLKISNEKVRKSSFSDKLAKDKNVCKLFGNIVSTEKTVEKTPDNKFPVSKLAKDEETVEVTPKVTPKGQKTILSKTEKSAGKDTVDKTKIIKIDKKQTYAEKVQNKRNLLEKSSVGKNFASISNQSKLLIGGGDKTAKTNLYSDAKTSIEAASTSDVYEFQDSEPFEFETSEVVEKRPKKQLRKQMPAVTAATTATVTTPFSELLSSTTSSVGVATSTLSTTTVTNKRTKKSPLKDPEKQKPIKRGEKLNLTETTTTSSIMTPSTSTGTTSAITASVATLLLSTISSTSTTTSISDVASLLIPEKSKRGNDSTFDVLRKSPSFNMVSARDDIFTSSIPTTSNIIVQPIAIKAKAEDKLEQFINNTSKSVFINTNAIDISDPPKLLQKLMSKDDILTPEPITSLETVKRMLTDPNFELEPPKSEKPSIADKVLKAITQQQQQKQQEQQQQQQQAQQQANEKLENIFDNLVVSTSSSTEIANSSTLVPAITTANSSVFSSHSSSMFMQSGLPSDVGKNSSIVTNTYQSATTSSNRILDTEGLLMTIASTSGSNEPPKIEIPVIIKNVLSVGNICGNSLQLQTMQSCGSSIGKAKSILDSPEHKLDILDSISPKNNDLTETIQKLESVIMKTGPNINRFTEDSSDSTDSEQRLVIEDESQSSETNHPTSSSAQNEFMEEIDYENMIKTELSLIKDKVNYEHRI